MNRHSATSSSSPLYRGLMLAVLAFSAGYAAGAKGLNVGSGLTGGGPAASEEGVSCYFSPKGGCTEAVVEEIGRAQHEIQMQAYSFTSKDIAGALVDAHRRGVKITVVLDKSLLKEHSPAADEVADDSIPTYIDAQHAIAHNKIILIDGQTIITGSFNFTNQAEHSNAENLLVIHGRAKLYAAYAANFEHHLGHSEPYSAKTARESGGARASVR
jgi:phosphatidylserine/phosphatidylglycerophosphate/cardiolipin synthase-like enzyme